MKPTADNVRVRLDEFLTKPKRVTKNDLILVGLSGHGLQPRGSGDSYFCPADANPTFNVKDEGRVQVPKYPETLIGIQEVLGTLKQSGIGPKLLLVDACRVETARKGATRGIDEIETAILPPRTAVLLSCSRRQFSYEDEAFGGGHGAFFMCVIEGLKGGAIDAKRNRISWQRLATYVCDEVPDRINGTDHLKKGGAIQQPHMIANIGQEQPVLLTPAMLAKIDGLKPALPNKSSAPGPKPVPLTAPFDQKTARARQEEWVRYLGRMGVVEKNSVGIPMVLIPPGEFLMGSIESAEELREFEKKTGTPGTVLEHYTNEKQHRVRLTEPFYVSQREITKADFAKFASDAGYLSEAERDAKGGGGYDFAAGEFKASEKYNWKTVGWSPYGENHPVVNVTWNDVQKYVEWLNGKTDGGGYRLLTEAEWEYCARAGTTTRYPSGVDPETLAKIANIRDGTAKAKFPNWTTISAKDGYVFTAPTGTYVANNFGLYDMVGNVFEWCEDTYDSMYYGGQFSSNTAIDPVGPPSFEGSVRVLRGGCWFSDPVRCRSAYRRAFAPGHRSHDLGFRLALSSVK